MMANVEAFVDACEAHEEAGRESRLRHFSVGSVHLLDGATGDDFKWAYSARLVKSRAGKSYYERIRAGNSRGLCSLCNARTAKTIDHHLPQSAYPILSLCPNNLLPACFDCNHAKSDDTREVLNGYFDDLGTGRWLRAQIIPTNPCFVDYSIDDEQIGTQGLVERARSHFKVLKLRLTYGEEAARKIAGERRLLESILHSGGGDEVRAHLERSAESWEVDFPNSWQAAYYRGAAESDWYCQGGFSL